MNRIRVIWKGALIPIWLSEFVNLTIKIGIIQSFKTFAWHSLFIHCFIVVQMEPECSAGMLETDTEIHVSPPVKPINNKILAKEKPSLHSIISTLLDQFVRKPITENVNEYRVRLRILPIHESETFKKFLEKHGIFCQPYTVFIPKNSNICCKETDNWIGRIENEGSIKMEKSYFNVVFVDNKEEWLVSKENTVYLTNCLIRQLSLNIKQHVNVDLQMYSKPMQPLCENIKFYTFCQVIIIYISSHCFEFETSYILFYFSGM